MPRPYLTPDQYWQDPQSFWIHRDPITGYPTMNDQNQYVYGRSEYPQAWVSSTDYVSPGTPAPPFAEPTPIPETSYAPPTGAGYGAGYDQTYPEGLVGSTIDMPGTPAPPWAEPTPVPYSGGVTPSGPGSLSPIGGNPMGFGTSVTPDWGSLPSSNDYGWTAPNYSDPANMGTIGFPPGSELLNPFQTAPSIGNPLPTDFSSLGIPGSNSPGTGSLSPIGGNIMGFGTSVTPDWWSLPSSNDYGWSAPDYSTVTQNVGGPMDLSGYGGMIGGGFDLSGGGIDFGYLPSSSDYGWTAPNYSVAPSTYSFFPSGAGFDSPPSEVPPNVQIGSPGSPSDFGPSGTVGQTQVEVPTDQSIPAPSDWVDGLPPLTPPPDIPDVPPDQPPASVTPDGTQLPSGGGPDLGGGIPLQFTSPSIFLGGPGMGVPFGVSPAGGTFQGGTFIPAGGSLGTSFGPNGFSIVGQPGTNQYLGSGDTFSTAIGMFGLGAMNAPGGSFSLGMGGPESGISIRTQGDAPDFASGKAANEAAKLGMSVDDYMAMMDSATVGPTKFQTNALADPYKFWESRILQSRRMASAGSGSQPSGPIGIDPTYSIDAARNAGMYKGWTFDPVTGTFVPPTPAAPTAQPSKGSNK